MSVCFSLSLRADCLLLPESVLEKSRLIKVLDGDTFLFEVQGRVRLNLVNTPEMNFGKPSEPEPLAGEALNFIESIKDKYDFYLEPLGRDKYRRLLANVWLRPLGVVGHDEVGDQLEGDLILLAEKLVELGLGFQVFESSSAYSGCLSRAEAGARENGLGVWGRLDFWLNKERGGFVFWSGVVKRLTYSERYMWLGFSEDRVVRIPRFWLRQYQLVVPEENQELEFRGWAVVRPKSKYERYMLPLKSAEIFKFD